MAIISSTFSPLPATGWAAPMCVPGAIAATSAAIVIRKPADAAREPDGPTNTATGVFAAMIAVLMSRVESTRPPGVRRVMTSSAAPAASACGDRAAHVFGGDRMDDAVDLGEVDNRLWPVGRRRHEDRRHARRHRQQPRRRQRARNPHRITPGANAISSQPSADSYATQVHFSRTSRTLNLEPHREPPRTSGTLEPYSTVSPPASAWPPPTPDPSPERARASVRARFASARLQVRLGERDVRRRRVGAPDRDLQRVDRVLRPSGPQVDPADQQVRLRFVRRQVDRAPQLGQRLAVLLPVEQPAATLEMERRQLALIALRRGARR